MHQASVTPANPPVREADLLLSWYDRAHRDLPWRRTKDPYRIWVSEIMLQQTRVEAVKPYYERFLTRLPNLQALAQCPEEELMKLWEGLGYYSRARNLQAAAKEACAVYGGSLPGTRAELLTLPGIGPYTSAAIASICFGEPHPAVDGNVLRVWSRRNADGGFISEASVKKRMEEELRRVIPTDRPGDFNQAMMELGACICVPNGPAKCTECPWEGICRAHLEGREEAYPVKAAKKPRTVEERTILVLRDAGKVALRKRPGKGLLAGLYELPSIPGRQSARQVQTYLSGQGIKVLRIEDLGEAKHIFTHREWHMTGYLVRVDELERLPAGPDAAEWIFARLRDVEETYAIPSAFSAYLSALRE